MSDQQNRVQEIYVTGLRNQHAVEAQAIELLERQVGRLENYPELSDRMRLHIDESREQQRRLEELLEQAGSSHSSIKDAMMGFMGNMAALAHAPAQDEVIKNTFANFAFEHFEIAAYKSLLVLSDMAGASGAGAALKQSLQEEEAMARWIDEHLAATTQRYATRAAAGETAGV